MLCKLAPQLGLLCGSCSSPRGFASGFLQTAPRETALAFDYSFFYSDPPKGDFNPMSSHTCRAYTIGSRLRPTSCRYAMASARFNRYSYTRWVDPDP